MIGPTTNVVYFQFSGSLGHNIGSYDNNLFLERLVLYFLQLSEWGVEEIFVIFCNDCSTYKHPLPVAHILGFELNPTRIHNTVDEGPSESEDDSSLEEDVPDLEPLEDFPDLDQVNPPGPDPEELPDPPCCLHDATKLKELWCKIETTYTTYETDDQGYIKVNFE
jgi:hypothetical protein